MKEKGSGGGKEEKVGLVWFGWVKISIKERDIPPKPVIFCN